MIWKADLAWKPLISSYQLVSSPAEEYFSVKEDWGPIVMPLPLTCPMLGRFKPFWMFSHCLTATSGLHWYLFDPKTYFYFAVSFWCKGPKIKRCLAVQPCSWVLYSRTLKMGVCSPIQCFCELIAAAAKTDSKPVAASKSKFAEQSLLWDPTN